MEKFESHQRDLAQSLRSLREKFTEAKHDAQREVARFSDERVKLYGHLKQSREEYDCLKVLQGQNMADYQKQLSEESVVSSQKVTTTVMCRGSMTFDLESAHTQSGLPPTYMYGQGLGLGESLFPVGRSKIKAPY